MKKITLFILALCAFSLSANAAHRFYLCGVTSVTVDTLASTTKNRFDVTIQQVCKNTSEYNKDTVYTNTVTLILHSDDRTLEGVYTTEGSDPNSPSTNVNDQTISIYSSTGPSSRALRSDSISTFVIGKNAYGDYYIDECTLHFTKSKFNTTDTWTYYYCYDANEIRTEGISPTPFIFSYSGEYVQEFHSYDLTVTGLSIKDSTSDYGENRYFLTMQCSGSNRETNEIRNYEVQLALYTEGAEPTSIVGSYATKNGSKLMWSSNCYVKDLKTPKQRYLSNDSVSSITIVSTGTNTYNFSGGPLICTDLDMNYLAVTGNRRIEATHYYYFNSNNGGQGIDFSFDGENATLTPSGATGISNTESRSNARKISREGVVYIERNGQLYNLQGALIQ